MSSKAGDEGCVTRSKVNSIPRVNYTENLPAIIESPCENLTAPDIPPTPSTSPSQTNALSEGISSDSSVLNEPFRLFFKKSQLLNQTEFLNAVNGIV